MAIDYARAVAAQVHAVQDPGFRTEVKLRSFVASVVVDGLQIDTVFSTRSWCCHVVS